MSHSTTVQDGSESIYNIQPGTIDLSSEPGALCEVVIDFVVRFTNSAKLTQSVSSMIFDQISLLPLEEEDMFLPVFYGSIARNDPGPTLTQTGPSSNVREVLTSPSKLSVFLYTKILGRMDQSKNQEPR